ncbi:hypothetical protein [Methanobrevibacter sp.]|uniref:hypothetical protein n=1 Tax=Methanobrevibacter sp. TaxID=66852 RepID=UPI0025E45A57|nr:hypothetical protein [Methanobrevibacter sp.]
MSYLSLSTRNYMNSFNYSAGLKILEKSCAKLNENVEVRGWFEPWKRIDIGKIL